MNTKEKMVAAEARRLRVRNALDKASKALDSIKALEPELPIMKRDELEETVDTCAEHKDWAWILQTQALTILISLRKKLAGGRGKKAKEGEGMQAFYEEWSEKLGKSESWIRTNVAILSKHAAWSHWPPAEDGAPKRAHTYYGSEAVIDDDEMFTEVRADGGNAITVARFEPASELKRTHYEVSLLSSDPKAAVEWARTEILAGRECPATRLKAHIRSEEKRLQLDAEREGHRNLDDAWCDWDTRQLLTQLVVSLRIKKGEVIARALLLLRDEVNRQAQLHVHEHERERAA